MRSVLLDTNAYSAYMVGDEAISRAMGEAGEVLASVFVLGEIHAGFRGGTRMRRNQELLREFLAKPKVQILDATEETAEIYGQLKASLAKAGTPIPVHDVWIAAHALQTGSVLITYDAHFLQVPGLRIWMELAPG